MPELEVSLLLEPEPPSTRAESASSLVKETLTEEAFLHSLGASAEPETKLAAIHWTMLVCDSRGWRCTYLIQKPINSRRNNAHNTLLANIALIQRHTRLAEITQSALLHNREDLLPARLGLLIESHAEEPIGLLMRQTHGNGLAADVEVGDVLGEVGREAAAGGLVFVVVREADGGRVFELEVRGGEADEGGEEDGGAHFEG